MPKGSAEEIGSENFADSFSFLFAGISVLPQAEGTADALTVVSTNSLPVAENAVLPEVTVQPMVFEDLQKFSASFKSEAKSFQAFGNEIQTLLGTKNLIKKPVETFSSSNLQINVLDAAKPPETITNTEVAVKPLVMSENEIPAKCEKDVPLDISSPTEIQLKPEIKVPEKLKSDEIEIADVPLSLKASPNLRVFDNIKPRRKEAAPEIADEILTETPEIPSFGNLRSVENTTVQPGLQLVQTPLKTTESVNSVGERSAPKPFEIISVKSPVTANIKPEPKGQVIAFPEIPSDVQIAEVEVLNAPHSEAAPAEIKTEISAPAILAPLPLNDIQRRKLPSLAKTAFEMKSGENGQNLDIKIGETSEIKTAEPQIDVVKTSVENSVQPIRPQFQPEQFQRLKPTDERIMPISVAKAEPEMKIGGVGVETQTQSNNAGSDLNRKTAETVSVGIEDRTENTAKFSKMIHDISKTINADHAPTPIAQTALSTPEQKVRETDIIKQIDAQMLQLADFPARKEGKQVLRMKLNPEELGTVEIQLEKTASGSISAHFRTDNDSAKHILTNNLEQLRESLQNLGMQVGQLDISNGNSNAAGQQFRENSQRNYEAVENTLVNQKFDENTEHAADLTPTGSNRLVNLRA